MPAMLLNQVDKRTRSVGAYPSRIARKVASLVQQLEPYSKLVHQPLRSEVLQYLERMN
jgi:hypothetical protein